MNCEQAQTLLVAYLDGEVTPSERVMIQAHLSDCTDCQQELTLLSTARSRVHAVLQHRMIHVTPSAEAWNRLEARLTKPAQPSSTQVHLAPGMKQLIQSFFGSVSMHKKWTLFSAFAAIVAIMAAVVFSAEMTTSVSAREIIDRASAAQSPVVSEGIQHSKVETYSINDLTDKEGVKTILDSYGDLQNGNYWNVILDDNGTVLDVTAYDGEYTYSQDYNVARSNGEPLTIYRTPQNNVDLKPVGNNEWDGKAIFEQMRSDPNLRLVGKETWDDGRKVYALQSQQLVKTMLSGQLEQPQGLVTIYFDVNTYKQLGYRITMQKDGNEILLASQKILVDEILPAGTTVPLDLNNLQGVVVVDDPNQEHGDLLPAVITPEELAAKTTSGYLLKNIPDGYTLEITAPPKQSEGEPYIHIAAYRNEANDYFVIQSGMGWGLDGDVDETYTTASGLVLSFGQDFSDPNGKQSILAIAETTDGTTFMISSNLPREIVKAWAEELVNVK